MSKQTLKAPEKSSQAERQADFPLDKYVFRTATYGLAGFGVGLAASLFFKHKLPITALFTGAGAGYGMHGLTEDWQNYQKYKSWMNTQTQQRRDDGSQGGRDLDSFSFDQYVRAQKNQEWNRQPKDEFKLSQQKRDQQEKDNYMFERQGQKSDQDKTENQYQQKRAQQERGEGQSQKSNQEKADNQRQQRDQQKKDNYMFERQGQKSDQDKTENQYQQKRAQQERGEGQSQKSNQEKADSQRQKRDQKEQDSSKFERQGQKSNQEKAENQQQKRDQKEQDKDSGSKFERKGQQGKQEGKANEQQSQQGKQGQQVKRQAKEEPLNPEAQQKKDIAERNYDKSEEEQGPPKMGQGRNVYPFSQDRAKRTEDAVYSQSMQGTKHRMDEIERGERGPQNPMIPPSQRDWTGGHANKGVLPGQVHRGVPEADKMGKSPRPDTEPNKNPDQGAPQQGNQALSNIDLKGQSLQTFQSNPLPLGKAGPTHEIQKSYQEGRNRATDPNLDNTRRRVAGMEQDRMGKSVKSGTQFTQIDKSDTEAGVHNYQPGAEQNIKNKVTSVIE